MRKKFTMLLASLFLVMGTAWAQNVVTSTEDAPVYYLIASYDRGGVITYENVDGDAVAQHTNYSAEGKSSWYFEAVPGNQDGGVYIVSKNKTDGGDKIYLGADRKASKTSAVWYILGHQYTDLGYAISSEKEFDGSNCCIDAGKPDLGSWYPKAADDWQGTTWIFMGDVTNSKYNPNSHVTQKGTSGRRITSITVNGVTKNIWANGIAFVDYTNSLTFTVPCGEEVSLSIGRTGGWMQAFAYVDKAGDGFVTEGVEADGYTPTGDLVTYSCYSANDNESGVNSKGVALEKDARNTVAMPSFVAPEEPGLYRLRINYDWNSLDPNGTNGKITSSGGQFVDVMLEVKAGSVDVHYSYKHNGVTLYEETMTSVVGADYPAPAVAIPYGVTITNRPTGTIAEEDVEDGVVNKDIEIAVSLPFEYAATYESVKHWYHMSIHSGDKYYLFYEENDEAMNISNVRTVDAAKRSEFSWAFVGNPFTGYKIVNRAAGANKILSASTTMAGTEGGSTYPVLTDATALDGKNTYWIPTPSTHATGGFYLAQKDYPSNRMNYRNPNLSFWTGGAGAGSTFQIAECGVLDLEDLSNEKAYMLAAERSPLMYSTTQDMTTKLSSGMVDGVAANPKDAKQQFLVLRSTKTEAGKYYLYNVAAGKFVAADLTFTDVPAPVLSFESHTTAKYEIYPWWVKIGDKYVAPGNGGTQGNKIFHQETGLQDDDGKRFNIVEAGDYNTAAVLEKIRVAENLVKTAADLQNNRVYTVTPSNTASTGAWDVKDDKSMLSLSIYTGGINATKESQQFAFLKVNEEFYLYSYSAEKFVADNGAGQALTAELTDECLVTFDASTIADKANYPLCVRVGGNHLCATSADWFAGNGGVVTNWDDTGDAGNAVAIVATYNEVDLSDVVAKVGTYQINRLKSELSTLITEAQAYAAKEYIHSEALEVAITAAQGIKDKEGVTYSELTEQITALSAAIDEAAFVTEIDRFSNTAVYVFKGEKGYLMYDGTNDYLASTYKQTSLAVGDEVPNCQWVVYTSASGKQYMYNLGAQKFMGTAVNGGAPIPFSATPQSAGLQFKKTQKADYPIMMSANGGAGAVNHVNSNDYGIMNWHGGFTALNDAGNSHQVRVVGEFDEEKLATIRMIVAKYEFEAAVDEATARFAYTNDMPGCYSCPSESAEKFSEIDSWDYENATVAELEAKIAELEAILDAFTINLPIVGKFYRLAYDFGTEEEPNIKYVQAVASNAPGKANAMVMTADDESAASIFYYDGGDNTESADDDKLLSFSAGQYVSEHDGTRGLQPVGGEAGKTSFAPGSKVGKLYVTVQHTFHANKDGEIYFVDHCPTQNAHDEHNFIVKEVTTLPVTVSDAGYATLYAPVALEIPTGVTAYVGVKVDNYLDLTDITKVVDNGIIPANTGVILEATAATYNFNIADAVPALDPSSNLLTGKYPKSEKNADAKVYTLQNGTNGVGFYLFNGYKMEDETKVTTYINGFRAWVELPAEQSAPALAFRFRGNGTTDIENSEFTIQDSAIIYDLTGRRIEKIVEKGIYIVNGKKVVIK